MGDVVTFRRKTAGEKHGNKILCRSNFHKWEVVKENQFDVKQGKLVTLYRCARCGATKTEVR